MNEKDTKFWQFLRSGLRKLSQRWPPIYQALALAKRPYIGENSKRKFSYQCAECNGLFDAKSVQVDHHIPAGKLQRKEDVAEFIDKLFCGVEGLRVLCKTCHEIKTFQERYGGTKEEAIIAKKVAKFKSLSAYQQKETLTILYKCDIVYIDKQFGNATKRVAAYKEYLTKEIE